MVKIKNISYCTADHTPLSISNLMDLTENTYKTFWLKNNKTPDKFKNSAEQNLKCFNWIVEHSDSVENVGYNLVNSGICFNSQFKLFYHIDNLCVFQIIDCFGNESYLSIEEVEEDE